MDVLILSDLHLGTGASRAEAMLNDIRHLARKARRVILNGDTLDRMEKPDAHPRVNAFLAQAREACQSYDAPPEILTGNHDPAISDRHFSYLPASQTLIFHGDCVSDCTHLYKLEDQMLARSMQEKWDALGGRPPAFKDLVGVYRAVQGEHLRQHPRIREPHTVLDYLKIVAFPPHKPFYILRYWWQSPRKAAALGRTFDQPVRNVVIGHTHLAGRWRFGDLTVHNTGSFMPISSPYAAIEENGKLRLERLSRLLRTHTTVSMPAAPVQPAVSK